MSWSLLNRGGHRLGGWRRSGQSPLFANLDVVAIALEPLSELLLEEAPPRVRTMVSGLREKRNKHSKNKNRGKEEDECKTASNVRLGNL